MSGSSARPTHQEQIAQLNAQVLLLNGVVARLLASVHPDKAARQSSLEEVINEISSQLEFGHFMPRNKPYQSRC